MIGLLARRLAAVLAVLTVMSGPAAAFLVAAPAVAIAQAGSDVAVDIEDEVMCLSCGRPLSSSGGTGAEDQRALIRRLVDQGLTKEQIKERLVTEYGERILVKNASPVAGAAPWAAAIAGLLVIAGVLRRRSTGDAGDAGNAGNDDSSGDGGAPADSPIDAAIEARIDAELRDAQ